MLDNKIALLVPLRNQNSGHLLDLFRAKSLKEVDLINEPLVLVILLRGYLPDDVPEGFPIDGPHLGGGYRLETRRSGRVVEEREFAEEAGLFYGCSLLFVNKHRELPLLDDEEARSLVPLFKEEFALVDVAKKHLRYDFLPLKINIQRNGGMAEWVRSAAYSRSWDRL